MTRGQSAPPSRPEPASGRHAFPKSRRLLRTKEFRQVYDSGFRLPCSSFVAFCWKSPDPCGPRIGFTATRGLGGAVDRNRMKRRVREALRLRLDELGPNWWVVFNLRRRALDAPRAAVEADLAKVFARCDG